MRGKRGYKTLERRRGKGGCNVGGCDVLGGDDV